VTESPRPASLRTLGLVLAGLAVPALAVAALMMYIAWQHNSQGELYEAGEIHWAAWLAVGWSWALALWVPLAALAAAVWGATTWSARRRARSDAPAG
jgi:hypothetical protein